MDEKKFEMSRRQVLRCGVLTGASVLCYRAMSWAEFFQDCTTNCFDEILPEPTNCGIQEVWSTSPFIIDPFNDLNTLPVPQAMRPGYRGVDTLLADPADPNNWLVQKWTDPTTHQCQLANPRVLNPGDMLNCLQDSYGGSHQVKPGDNKPDIGFPGNYHLDPNPILYHIRLKVAPHAFTNSPVRPIDRNGAFLAQLPTGTPVDANGIALPGSVIYGFNGTFPGPMINADFGKPVIVRFENDLDILNQDVGDFGVPQFLTHLHNGHTAPESDGQPHYMQHNEGGYILNDYVDNLYLNWPAGGDPNETQSFLWFHDHRMHHTGANVYKGMVGLFPMYDPGVQARDANGVPITDANGDPVLLAGTGLDPGDETKGLRLPGVRVPNTVGDVPLTDPNAVLDGTFNVKYDVPMALYDCRLDDGVTPHADFRVGDALINGDPPVNPPPPVDPLVCGATHPDQWGKLFFRYHPNHGFVGDVFTVNCVAFPVLKVYKRRYRFRWLGASIARIYELAFMTSANGPQADPGSQGQWKIPDGVLWKPNAMRQIASMGGLLPSPIDRDSIQIWPATRREAIVDFTDAPTDQVIYLTNVLEMPDGRKPDFRPGDPLNARQYKVPLVKIIVMGDALPEPDNSVMPALGSTLRPMPQIPTPAELALLPHRFFTLARSGKFGDEAQWLINDLPFDPTQSLTELPGPGNPGGIGNPKLGTGEVWTVANGGGGWVHPMHMHMEEHTVLSREGGVNLVEHAASDTGKEDVANLDPGEAVTFFRRFRTFTGQYVAHCHNLAHEDHNMMFGWKIDPAPIPPPVGTPKAFPDQATTRMNQAVIIPVLKNDVTFTGQPLADINGVPLPEAHVVQISIAGRAPGNGRAAHLIDHSGIEYTPETGFVGTDSFSYTVTVQPDPNLPDTLTSNDALVTITVAPPGAPIANNDAVTMNMNTFTVIPVLANDKTSDGQPIDAAAVDAVTLFPPAPTGMAVVNPDKTITYTPDADFVGTDTFQYTVTQFGETSQPATVSVTVNAVNQTLSVKKAMVNMRGRLVTTKGPLWNVQGAGALPNADVTIQAGNAVIKTVKANRRGIWRYAGRALPGLTNPTTVTVISTGAGALTVPLTVR
ncbi:MAG: Ig-like domain-containing protein [Syntrophobacteraceae bacterium]